jgi:hypothetical protein
MNVDSRSVAQQAFGRRLTGQCLQLFGVIEAELITVFERNNKKQLEFFFSQFHQKPYPYLLASLPNAYILEQFQESYYFDADIQVLDPRKSFLRRRSLPEHTVMQNETEYSLSLSLSRGVVNICTDLLRFNLFWLLKYLVELQIYRYE